MRPASPRTRACGQGIAAVSAGASRCAAAGGLTDGVRAHLRPADGPCACPLSFLPNARTSVPRPRSGHRTQRISSRDARTLRQARSAVNVGVPRGLCSGGGGRSHSLAASARRLAMKASTAPRSPSLRLRASACASATEASRASWALNHPGSDDRAFRPPRAGDAGLEAPTGRTGRRSLTLHAARARAARSLRCSSDRVRHRPT